MARKLEEMFPDGIWLALISPSGEEVSERVKLDGHPVSLQYTGDPIGCAARIGLFNSADAPEPVITDVTYPNTPIHQFQTLTLTGLTVNGGEELIRSPEAEFRA